MALAAQGLTVRRASGRVDRRHLRKVFGHVGLIQIDSVNVLARSHDLVLFSRLGAHETSLLARATAAGEVFEFWGHEASHIPVEHHHLLRWKMAAAAGGAAWGGLVRLHHERPEFIEEVFSRVAASGHPVVAADLATRERPKGPWWDWDDTKRALEFLFWCGRVAARRRARDFARVYDLPERMLPAAVLAKPTPPEPEARKELLVLAARSLGVATGTDLADYHRQNRPAVRPLLAELVEDGRLVPARVEGWTQPAYLHAEARRPRQVRARALLSPFDSLIWERARTERLFGFHYRVEIYVPKPQRRYGYYVLPFLLGDRLVGRVDLKADRQAGVLRVQSAHAEDSVEHAGYSEVAAELAAELGDMARWLALDRIDVTRTGTLAPALRQACAATTL